MLLKFNLYNAVLHPIWVNANEVVWVEETIREIIDVAVIHTGSGDVVVLDPIRDVANKIKNALK